MGEGVPSQKVSCCVYVCLLAPFFLYMFYFFNKNTILLCRRLSPVLTSWDGLIWAVCLVHARSIGGGGEEEEERERSSTLYYCCVLVRVS